MAIGQGFNTKAVIGKESTWGTGVAGNTILTFTEESFERAITKLRNSYLDATTSFKEVRSSHVTVDNAVTVEAVYDTITGATIGKDDIILGALGSATFRTTGARVEYLPTAVLSTSFTIAFNKQVSVWEVQGAKIKQLEITGTVGETVKLNASVIGKELLRTGDSGIVNTAAAIDALVNTVEPELVAFDDIVFRIGTHGAALTAADQINVSEFTITINNNLTDPTFATPKQNASAIHTLEPIRNGKREVTFSFTVPRYENDNFFSWLNASTKVQIDIKATSPNGNEFNIYLPNCVLESANAPVAGPEVFPVTVNGIALYNGSTNTNMTFTQGAAITEEIGIETKDERTAAP